MFSGPASSKSKYILLVERHAYNTHLFLFPCLANQVEILVEENTFIYIQTIWISPAANIRHSVYAVGDWYSSYLSHAVTNLETQKCTHIPPAVGPDLCLGLRLAVFQVAGLDLLVPPKANTWNPCCPQIPSLNCVLSSTWLLNLSFYSPLSGLPLSIP